MKADAQTLVPITVLGWIVYRRVTRSIGFQPYSARRMRARLLFVGFFGLLIAGFNGFRPETFAAVAAGSVAGGTLAFYAVRHLVREWRDGKLFIKTHIIIESSVLVLFLGRLAYRFVKVGSMSGVFDPTPASPPYTGDPFTLGFYFVLLAYYFGYYGWLLSRRETLLADQSSKLPPVL